MQTFFKAMFLAPLLLGLQSSSSSAIPLTDMSSFRQVVAQANDSRQAEAERLMQDGEEKLKAKLYRNAAQLFEDAVLIYREIKDYEKALVAIEKLEEIYITLGEESRLTTIRLEKVTMENAIQGIRAGDRTVELAGSGIEISSLIESFSNPTLIDSRIRALERELESGGEEDTLVNVVWLASAHLYRGNSEKAIQYFEQAMELDTEPYYDYLFGVGKAHLQERNYELAASKFEEAIALVRSDRTRHMDSLAVFSRENYPYIDELLSTVSEGYAKPESEFLSALAIADLELGNVSESIAHSQAARSILDELGISDENLEILSQADLALGQALFQTGNYQEAESSFRLAFEQISTLISDPSAQKAISSLYGGQFGKITYAEMLSQASSHLQEVLIAQDKSLEALQVAEQGKSVILQQDLAPQESNAKSESGGRSIDEQKLIELIQSGQPASDEDLEELGVDVNDMLSVLKFVTDFGPDLAIDMPERTRPQRAPVEYLDISTVKSVAKEQQTTIVHYSVISDGDASFVPPFLRSQVNMLRIQQPEKAIYIWVVQPNGDVHFRAVPFPGGKPLPQFVTSSRTALGAKGFSLNLDSDIGQQAQILQELHQLLIEPIAELLPQDPQQLVTFIPDRSLFLVPFAVLQDSFGQYLIDRHTILANTSIKAMISSQKSNSSFISSDTLSGSDALVVGNPTMPNVGSPPRPLASLPGAAIEADSVATRFGTQMLTGSDATKVAVLERMPQARLIHFATHGLLDDVYGFGAPGAIALAPSSVDEGWLTATEIGDLTLQADLAVLSACDTGGGIVTSDGIVGLSRAFIEAGVPSVVSSLWQVPDEATVFLMERFYDNLETQPNKAQALRQAMLATRAEFSYDDPVIWAAFVLIGSPE